MSPPTLETARLRLRPWRDEDLAPFAALNADPCVREHFAGTLTRAESDKAAARIRADLLQRGFGLWAVDLPGAGFIGFTGLTIPQFDAPFMPTVEIGWRLAFDHWGQGYASEAATAALAHGFGALALPEIVAFTVPGNRRSIAVMHRIGMTRSATDDFEHPYFPENHALRPHWLFRIKRPS